MWSSKPQSSNLSSNPESLKPLLPTSQTHGSAFSPRLVSSQNINTSQISSVSVSILSFPLSHLHKLPPIIPPSLNSIPNLQRLSMTSFKKVVILVPFPDLISKPLSAPSNPPHSPSFQ